MRAAAVLVLGLGLLLLTGPDLPGQGKGKEVKRFGLLLDVEAYPQDTPQKALASVVKAINLKQYDYLLAHLADPKFVERRLEEYKKELGAGAKEETKTFLAFQRLVKVTTEHFQDDPTKVKDLQRYAKDGEWNNVSDTVSAASLKNMPTRKVFMRKTGDRWMIEDREK